jgi:hypothetical protein
MGAAKEHRNGEEWREEGEIGGGESDWWTQVGTGGDKNVTCGSGLDEGEI